MSIDLGAEAFSIPPGAVTNLIHDFVEDPDLPLFVRNLFETLSHNIDSARSIDGPHCRAVSYFCQSELRENYAFRVYFRGNMGQIEVIRVDFQNHRDYEIQSLYTKGEEVAL